VRLISVTGERPFEKICADFRDLRRRRRGDADGMALADP